MQFPLSIKEMRLALGLNQEKMANLLDISRAQLSMAESERRNLPTKALLRYNQINTLLETKSKTDPSRDLLSLEKKIQIISEMLQQLKVEENKLISRQKQIAQSQKNSEMMGLLLSHFDDLQSSDFEPEGDRLWKESVGTYLPEQDHEKAWREIYALGLELEAIQFKIEKIEDELKSAEN
jgi:transcriptional regulator with XRE-family HTH domain